MQTVDEFYQTLPYTALDASQARALVTPPTDEVAHADLLRVCETCSAAEISVAVQRGLHPLFDWGNKLPAVSGDYHDWEWCKVYPRGKTADRILLRQWLTEALVAARRRGQQL